MLLKDNFNMENVQRLRDLTGRDPNLLERVVYAFGLLEAIKQAGIPFIFKGGTSLMLLMEHPMRLSTDIDIIVKPGTDIDYYIQEATKIFPFLKCEEQVRIGKNNIEKRHFKFIYKSPVRDSEFYILLDVVFAESPYALLTEKEICNELLLVEGPEVYVTVPTADCILGDKLTAFASHTTGVTFGKELEIIKQLYDVANLIDVMTDQKLHHKQFLSLSV
ncbi:MAG: nucleotidyl transferase AbiEii/AbiGii toxin family protein [Bacteroidales bacterium]|nr:nucleotidyl transferase AbiEii/AbiGii toxin family protein [Bacteroidales bacterium]